MDNKKMNLTALQMKCIIIIQKIDFGDIEGAKEEALHLNDMIIAERKVMDEWKDLFFKIANSF